MPFVRKQYKHSDFTLHNIICVRLLTEFTCVKFENLDLTKYIFLKGIFCIKLIRKKKWLDCLTLEEEGKILDMSRFIGWLVFRLGDTTFPIVRRARQEPKV